MHKTIVATALVLFTAAGVCLAQPPGITREMIGRSLPLEGAPLAEPGPYMVASEAAFGSPGHHLYRPSTLEAFEEGLAARHGVGQRRLRDRQHALLGLPDDDRLLRLPRIGYGASGRCTAAGCSGGGSVVESRVVMGRQQRRWPPISGDNGTVLFREQRREQCDAEWTPPQASHCFQTTSAG
jgi:hypothetical protein